MVANSKKVFILMFLFVKMSDVYHCKNKENFKKITHIGFKILCVCRTSWTFLIVWEWDTSSHSVDVFWMCDRCVTDGRRMCGRQMRIQIHCWNRTFMYISHIRALTDAHPLAHPSHIQADFARICLNRCVLIGASVAYPCTFRIYV